MVPLSIAQGCTPCDHVPKLVWELAPSNNGNDGPDHRRFLTVPIYVLPQGGLGEKAHASAPQSLTLGQAMAQVYQQDDEDDMVDESRNKKTLDWHRAMYKAIHQEPAYQRTLSPSLLLAAQERARVVMARSASDPNKTLMGWSSSLVWLPPQPPPEAPPPEPVRSKQEVEDERAQALLIRYLTWPAIMDPAARDTTSPVDFLQQVGGELKKQPVLWCTFELSDAGPTAAMIRQMERWQ